MTSMRVEDCTIDPTWEPSSNSWGECGQHRVFERVELLRRVEVWAGRTEDYGEDRWWVYLKAPGGEMTAEGWGVPALMAQAIIYELLKEKSDAT
jgi:hypothetical protein